MIRMAYHGYQCFAGKTAWNGSDVNGEQSPDGRLECVWYPLCPMKRFDRTGRPDRKWVESHCLSGRRKCVRFKLQAQGGPIRTGCFLTAFRTTA